MRGVSRGSIAAFAAALHLLGPSARANGRFPATNQLVVSPTDPNLLVLRATFGFVVSHDAGRTWSWICESAVGFSSEEDPAIAVTANGAILAGLYEGLSISPDMGCTWGFASALSGWVAIDVAVRPTTPDAALSLAWIEQHGDGGTTTFENRIFATSGDGASWAPLGTVLDPTLLYSTVDVAPSDPQRIYVSGVSGPYQTASIVVSTSHDSGASFTSAPLPANVAIENGAYIAGVDPTNADRLYVRSWPVSRLYVSDDGGRSFRSVLTFSGEMQGFAIAEGGRTIYAGGPNDGLWKADSTSLAFTRVSELAVGCLAASGGTLYACANGAFALGASSDGGESFAPLFQLAELPPPPACPRGSTIAACVPQYVPLCQSLGGCMDDAGIPDDAGGAVQAPLLDAGSPRATSPGARSNSGGCSGSARRVPLAPAAVIASALAAALWTRRRKRIVRPPTPQSRWRDSA